MAIVEPFRSVQYNGDCAGMLDRLITPPYDVISPEEQEAFYQAGNNKYTRVAATLRSWLNDGVLVRSQRESFTVYQMEFRRPDGARRTIDGIVALVKVESYGRGRVLPHEKTYRGPKEDQLNLLRSCHAHLTPIHALFNDKEHHVSKEYSRVMEKSPDQEAEDSEEIVHRTWQLQDEEAISNIRRVLSEKSLFIADGHHRYETSLAYRDEMRASQAQDAGAGPEYVMMYLTSMSHPGLTILPAHRMVKGLPEINAARILEKLDPYFDIEAVSLGAEDVHAAARTLVTRVSSFSEELGKFGMVFGQEDRFWLLKLKSIDAVDALINAATPAPLREMDVTILRYAIMGHGLGLDRDRPEGHIEYTPSADEVLEKARTGKIQVAFIHNPTRVEQVQAAAELGHKLPHKSTYFYPKIASGLVLNVF
ncbi:MAG: DUF1015 domain-containing protein [Deltaproteobacteria bacterium]